MTPIPPPDTAPVFYDGPFTTPRPQHPHCVAVIACDAAGPGLPR